MSSRKWWRAYWWVRSGIRVVNNTHTVNEWYETNVDTTRGEQWIGMHFPCVLYRTLNDLPTRRREINLYPELT
jgi:hypothetical protein